MTVRYYDAVLISTLTGLTPICSSIALLFSMLGGLLSDLVRQSPRQGWCKSFSIRLDG